MDKYTDIDCPDCYGKGVKTTGFDRGYCRRCHSKGKLPTCDPELLLERIKQLEKAVLKLTLDSSPPIC